MASRRKFILINQALGYIVCSVGVGSDTGSDLFLHWLTAFPLTPDIS